MWIFFFLKDALFDNIIMLLHARINMITFFLLLLFILLFLLLLFSKISLHRIRRILPFLSRQLYSLHPYQYTVPPLIRSILCKLHCRERFQFVSYSLIPQAVANKTIFTLFEPRRIIPTIPLLCTAVLLSLIHI